MKGILWDCYLGVPLESQTTGPQTPNKASAETFNRCLSLKPDLFAPASYPSTGGIGKSLHSKKGAFLMANRCNRIHPMVVIKTKTRRMIPGATTKNDTILSPKSNSVMP